MIGMIETIQAIRLTCDACGNVRIIDAAEALPRRCAKKACQSTAWNKSSPTAAVEAKPQRKRAAKPQIEVAPQEELPHIEDKPHEENSSEWSESEQTIARKMGHPLGHDCVFCNRMRAMMKPKAEKPAAAPAEKKTPPKKRKR
jgi:hypothetical protein